MNVLESVQRFAEAIVERIGVWLLLIAFVVGVGLWLYLNPSRMRNAGLFDLAEHRWLALVFCCVVSAVVLHCVRLVWSHVIHWRANRETNRLQSRLRALSLEERMVLRGFLDENNQGIFLRPHPLVDQLCSKGFLIKRNPHPYEAKVGYNVTNAVFEALHSDRRIFEDTFPTDAPSDWP